jgi:short-subunit dehydrogenase
VNTRPASSIKTSPTSRRRCIWITGASSGIGAALAEAYAREAGTDLILSGRSRERLEAVIGRCRAAGARVERLLFDAGIPSERNRTVDGLSSRGVVPDIIINNAGISQRGYAADTTFSIDRDIMEVDYLAAIHLTKAVLPGMIERGSGIVVAVSSVAGFIPAPRRSAYNAAKAAQIAFFRTLSNELEGTAIQVTTVIPGFVRTRISENALDSRGETWGRLDDNQAGGISPERAARDILHGISAGRRVIYTGISPRLRIALILNRLAPVMLDRILQRGKVT